MNAVKDNSETKESLLNASIEIFAEKGYEGATVKDIADHAQVNVALINYHFGGKEGLYRAVLESAAQTRLESVDRVLKKVTTSSEFKIRLKLFLEEFMHCHLQRPLVMKILHRDFDGQHPIALEVFNEIIQDMILKTTKFIDENKDSGVLRSDLESGCFVSFLMGSVIHSLRMDFLRKKFLGQTLESESFRNQFIDQLVQTLCEGGLQGGKNEVSS